MAKNKKTKPQGAGKKKKGRSSESYFKVADSSSPKATKVSVLKEKYEKEILPALKEKLNIKNTMQIPRLREIIVNSCSKEAVANPKVLDAVVGELAVITGQCPIVTRAKKSIAGFKLREGMPIGAKVTLRKNLMYDFMNRLVNICIPRVRDFSGLSTSSFDGRGNYTLGLRDQIIFPEIDYNKVDKSRGMNITFVTTSKDNEGARLLLTELGMPFKK